VYINKDDKMHSPHNYYPKMTTVQPCQQCELEVKCYTCPECNSMYCPDCLSLDKDGVSLVFPKQRFHSKQQVFEILYPDEGVTFKEIQEEDPKDERVLHTEENYYRFKGETEDQLRRFSEIHKNEYKQEMDKRAEKKKREKQRKWEKCVEKLHTLVHPGGDVPFVPPKPIFPPTKPQEEEEEELGETVPTSTTSTSPAPPPKVEPIQQMGSVATSPAYSPVYVAPVPETKKARRTTSSRREKIVETVVDLAQELEELPEAIRMKLIESLFQKTLKFEGRDMIEKVVDDSFGQEMVTDE
jgi:hypothetical protein